MKVRLRHPRSGRQRTIKVGWSWTLFLSSGVFGLPLFLQGLPTWGFIFLTLSIVDLTEPLFAGQHGQTVSDLIDVVLLSLTVWLGIKGNEMIGRTLLAQGWRMAEPHSDAARHAVQAWGLGSDEVRTITLI